MHKESKLESCGLATEITELRCLAREDKDIQIDGDTMSKPCEYGQNVCPDLTRRQAKMHSLMMFGSLCFFSLGADPVVTPLISQSPTMPWEEPSRSQQTRLAHNHIISISSATWPTDHRDQSLALDENALFAPSDKHDVWKKPAFLIFNSGVICGSLG